MSNYKQITNGNPLGEFLWAAFLCGQRNAAKDIMTFFIFVHSFLFELAMQKEKNEPRKEKTAPWLRL